MGQAISDTMENIYTYTIALMESLQGLGGWL
jgi:hypothetical protein